MHFEYEYELVILGKKNVKVKLSIIEWITAMF